MAVYREGYAILKQISTAHVQIFPDAADFGAPVRKDDKLWNAAKQIVDMYGKKHTRQINSGCLSIIIELIDEWAVSDEVKTIAQATEEYRLEYIPCKKGCCKDYDGFVHIYKIK